MGLDSEGEETQQRPIVAPFSPTQEGIQQMPAQTEEDVTYIVSRKPNKIIEKRTSFMGG